MYNIKCLLEFFLSLATVALVTSLSSCLGTKFSTGADARTAAACSSFQKRKKKNNRSSNKVKPRLSLAKIFHLFMLYRHRHCQRNAVAFLWMPFFLLTQPKESGQLQLIRRSLRWRWYTDYRARPYVCCQQHAARVLFSTGTEALLLICIMKLPAARSFHGWINISTPEKITETFVIPNLCLDNGWYWTDSTEQYNCGSCLIFKSCKNEQLCLSMAQKWSSAWAIL